MPAASRPFDDCPDPLLRGVRGVLTDIDDTLTQGGAIEPCQSTSVPNTSNNRTLTSCMRCLA
jgi:hypothetical protein